MTLGEANLSSSSETDCGSGSGELDAADDDKQREWSWILVGEHSGTKRGSRQIAQSERDCVASRMVGWRPREMNASLEVKSVVVRVVVVRVEEDIFEGVFGNVL